MRTCVFALLVGYSTVLPAAEPRTYRVDEKVEGKTYQEWTTAWWQWALAIAKDRNPLLDATGERAAEGQTGPVFFLAGTFKNEAMSRTCSVPAGKPVLVPVVNIIANDFFDNMKDEKLVADAKEGIDSAHDLRLTVNGKEIGKLDGFRVRSPLFRFEGPEKADNAVHALLYGKQRAVSDGYWVILHALPTGEHTIKFHGKLKNPEFTSDMTYKITVVEAKRK